MPHKNHQQHNAARRLKRQSDKQDPEKLAARQQREREAQARYYAKNRERILAAARSRAAKKYATDPETRLRPSREWKARNKAPLLEKQKAWRAAHRNNVRAWNRKVLYGLSQEDVDRMHASQNGRCGICRAKLDMETPRATHIDHCHATGRIRGLLCHSCNVGLGRFRDSIESLRGAIAYLERFA